MPVILGARLKPKAAEGRRPFRTLQPWEPLWSANGSSDGLDLFAECGEARGDGPFHLLMQKSGEALEPRHIDLAVQ